MNENLLGTRIQIVNPTNEHEWLRDCEGTVVQVNTDAFNYSVRVELRNNQLVFARLVRGEFEEIPKNEQQ